MAAKRVGENLLTQRLHQELRRNKYYVSDRQLVKTLSPIHVVELAE